MMKMLQSMSGSLNHILTSTGGQARIYHPSAAIIITKPLRAYLLVHLLHAVSCDAILDVPRELLLIGILILLDKVAHVVGYVTSEDVATVDVGIQLLRLGIIAREPQSRECQVHHQQLPSWQQRPGGMS